MAIFMWLRQFDIGAITELKTGRHVSSPDLVPAINRRAIDLTKLGVESGDRVFLYQNASIEFYVNLLAIWSLGGCAVPLEAALPEDVRARLSKKFSPALSIDPNGSMNTMETSAVEKRATALLLTTSGSTGDPKAIAHSFDGIALKMSALRAAIPVEQVARTLCALPVSFGHGLVCNSLYPLLSGQHLFIAPSFQPQVLAELDDVINRHSISFFSSTPIVWSMIGRFAEAQQKPSLKRVHCASAPLEGRHVKAMQAWASTTEFWNVYGLTEFLGWVSGALVDADTPAYVGRGWGVEARLERDELFLRAPFQSPEIEGWHATRDRAEFSKDGGWILKGRLDLVINRAGLKVFPDDVEAAAVAHPAVQESCCVPIADELRGQKVALVIVAKSALDAEEFRHWLESRLPPAQHPDIIRMMTELPRNVRGKIDRASLSADLSRESSKRD